MSHDTDKNLENFSLVRGDLYGSRFTATERCKRSVQERVYRLREQQRQSVPRAIESVAAGVTNPTGEPVKLMYRLKALRCSFTEVYRAVIVPQIKELNVAFGREYDDAA